MEKKNSNQTKLHTKLIISGDGLIRLTYEEFITIPIVHLYSELNSNVTMTDAISNRQTLLCGLTEWGSDVSLPALSIGWGWSFTPLNPPIYYKMDDQPFSNIMFIDGNGEKDKGEEETTNILIQYIGTMDWCNQVKEYINEKYS